MPEEPVDLGGLAEEMKDALIGRLKGLVEDEATLLPFAASVAGIAATAAASGDAAALDRISGIVSWLGAYHKVKLTNTTWDIVQDSIRWVTVGLSIGLNAVLPGLGTAAGNIAGAATGGSK